MENTFDKMYGEQNVSTADNSEPSSPYLMGDGLAYKSKSSKKKLKKQLKKTRKKLRKAKKHCKEFKNKLNSSNSELKELKQSKADLFNQSQQLQSFFMMTCIKQLIESDCREERRELGKMLSGGYDNVTLLQ